MNIGQSLGLDTTPTPKLPEVKSQRQIELEAELAESSGISENTFVVDEAITLAKTSLDFLAALVAPAIFSFCFPPVFVSVWVWLLSFVYKVREFPQLALGLPRGFGKTTLIKIFIMYCILFTNKRFILIVSSTATLAENILSDIVDMLEEPNVKALFGDWKIGVEKDTQSIKKFGYRGRNVTLAALGAGTSLRGLNIKNSRPDVMIFEDIQTREQADSEILSTNLEKWMVGTAMKAKSPAGCMFIFVANMYPTPWSILRKLKSNPTWTKFIAGGILSDGSSLWEELQPIAQLKKEFENDLAMGHPEIFYAEVLNDETASVNKSIDISKIPAYPFTPDEIAAGSFILIDPSNDKVKSDAVSIGYFEVHDSKPVMKEVVEDIMSPGTTINNALTMALKHGCTLIVVESNAYQYSLLYWFEFRCAQLGIIGISCVPIYSGAQSKNSRILTMFQEVLKGETVIHDDCKAVATLQMSSFNPLKTNNVDGILDLLTYAPKVMIQYPDLLVNMTIIQDQETESIRVIENNSSF